LNLAGDDTIVPTVVPADKNNWWQLEISELVYTNDLVLLQALSITLK
jgi:hypothetical protein